MSGRNDDARRLRSRRVVLFRAHQAVRATTAARPGRVGVRRRGRDAAGRGGGSAGEAPACPARDRAIMPRYHGDGVASDVRDPLPPVCARAKGPFSFQNKNF